MERNPWQSEPYLNFPFLVSYRMPYSLGFPGGSDGKESAYNAGVRVRYLDWENPLEKKMANHSSILAWRMDREWTEEPRELQSTGVQSQTRQQLTLSLSSILFYSSVWISTAPCSIWVGGSYILTGFEFTRFMSVIPA